MPESYTQVPPNSTGVKIGGQARTVGSDTVLYQRFIDTVDRVASAKVWVSTFRIPARAAASQVLFALHNDNTSAPLVGIRRLTLECDTAVAKATLSPVVRTLRCSTAPSNGTAVTKVLQDTADTLSSSVVCSADASADGTNSSTALSLGTVVGQAWEQTMPRFHTLAGYAGPPSLNLIPDDGAMHRDDPFYLRGGQGIGVRVDNPTTPTAGDWHYYVKCVWTEFTLP